MQDKYVGDIGDFGKYTLLKGLCAPKSMNGGPQLSLGLVWYLVPDDGREGDGSLTQYPELESCDRVLFTQLQEIAANKEARMVKSIREKGVLPPDTIFYEKPLTFDGMPPIGPAAREARLTLRRKWVDEALDKTGGCHVVFVDPDKGLEVPSVQPHHKRGPQYVFFCELRRYVARERRPSLVIYQHMSHQERVEHQIQKRLLQIVENLEGWATPFALQFRTSRFFFVVPAKAHEDTLFERAARFAKEPWDEHFRLVRLQAP